MTSSLITFNLTNFDEFSTDLIDFLSEIGQHFQSRIDGLLEKRKVKKATLDEFTKVEDIVHFLTENAPKVEPENWKIAALPNRLKNRQIDAGDVSPAFKDQLERYLSTSPDQLQGIQVDFDDGHCPTIGNQLASWKNVREIVQDKYLSQCPIMMLRPRALNMNDHLVNFDGKSMNGGLLDFAILMFENAKKLMEPNYEDRNGPFFYLSKLENANEAKLWNDIFDWTESKLELPKGTIKACILIENILAAFEMEAMLFNIKEHAIGLNCGMWDYSASILASFGHRPEFVLPDRHQYVNIKAQC